MSSSIDLEDETALELLHQMIRVRRFEERVQTLFRDGEIPGFVHLSLGHEGTHAGLGVAMQENDWLTAGNCRLHGQSLIKGVPMKEVLAEIFGKRTGCNRGKGGSMHVADADRHFYGHSATITSGMNPATGLALAQQMLDTGNVVVSMVGDGGTSRGPFHTALVFAAVWNLPIVFVIDNNQWAISYPASNLPPERLSNYGKPYQIPHESIDGTDVVTVYNTLGEALDRARNGGGPSLIESRVFRLEGHYEGDKETYRTEEDKKHAKEEGDPLKNFKERLFDSGHLQQEQYEELEADVEAEIDEAVEYARQSKMPDPSEAYEDIYNPPLSEQNGQEDGANGEKTLHSYDREEA